MATSIYLGAAEGQSGKSAIALGFLGQLMRRAGRVAIFRPVVTAHSADQPDELLELLGSRLDQPVQRAYGVTYDEIHADAVGAMARIVDRFHAVAADYDTVLVIGSDFTDVVTNTEFSFNARVAANLGSPMLIIVRANGLTPGEVRVSVDLAVGEARANHAKVLAVVANRAELIATDTAKGTTTDSAPDVDASSVDPTRPYLDALGGLNVPAFVIPDTPLLVAPTVADLMKACRGSLIHGDPLLLDRESLGLVVAAMTMPHVLDRLVDGGVVITPSDREDVILGVLMAHHSSTFPTASGLILNGGFALSPQVRRLIDGLGASLPIIVTEGGTMEVASTLAEVNGRITTTSTRKIDTALEVVDRHVAVDDLLDRLQVSISDVVTPLMFEHRLLARARASNAHIVLPEGEEERIIIAAGIVLNRGIARLTLLGDPATIHAKAAALGITIDAATIVQPTSEPMRERFAVEYAARRAHKGVTVEAARDIVVDSSYCGTMMVLLGEADGMVSGAVNTTAHTIRPALEVVKTVPGVSVVSSVFLMCLSDRVLVYGDCAVNPDPTAEQLADIAISSARTAAQFGIEPRIAMLSYSTGQSGTGADVDKVRTATALVRERAPDLSVEGPIQYDAAVDLAVAKTKLKDSLVAGRATVLIFPDLNTGNNTYKAVQRSASAVAIGPVLQGLNKPVNDLSRGALVEDIVNTIAITAIQAGGEG